LRTRTILIIFALVVITVTAAAFYPSLFNGFNNYDDNLLVTENQKITALSWNNIKAIFGSFHEFLYHPLVLVSYAIEYRFFGLNPLAYHATNYALHIINALLAFWLLLLITRSALVSLLATLLFAVHPLRVESVAWVTERKDLLSALFFLGTLIAYHRYSRSGSVAPYSCAILLCGLSLLSKPMGVTIPLIMLLIDWTDGRKLTRKVIVEKLPFFALALAAGIVALIAHYPAGSVRRMPAFTPVQRLFVAAYNIVFYLGKMIFPSGLSCLYQYPKCVEQSLPALYLAAPLIVAACIGLLLYAAPRSQKILFGGFFFLIAIAPVIQILPVGGGGAPADRFTYLPSIGIALIAAVGLNRSMASRSFTARAASSTLIIALIAALAALTWHRCHIWKDSVTLWSDVLRKNRDAVIAYTNRGVALDEKGEHQQAIADFTEALARDPRFNEAWNGRGNAYNSMGEYDRAVEDFSSAIAADPFFMEAYNNRGVAFFNLKRYDDAIADYSKLLGILPRHVKGWYNRGNAYLEKGMVARAAADLSRAIELNPRYAKAYCRRAYAKLMLGDAPGAREDAALSIRFDPSFLDAYGYLALAQKASGDIGGAIATLERAIGIAPAQSLSYLNCGILLNEAGEYDRAIERINRAIYIDPRLADSYFNRGNAYFGKNDLQNALSDYSRAIELRPSYPEAIFNRAVTSYRLGQYEAAWQDVAVLQQNNYPVSSQFIENLRKSSGRSQ